MIGDIEIARLIEQVCRNTNRAPARFLLACGLAKTHRPELDIRKPFTEINDPDSYSGRQYDENYITNFINKYQLPCNTTTAFLTPAFRTFNQPLYSTVKLSRRPREIYEAVILLLNLVQNGSLIARDLLLETIRQLILIRNEHQQRIEALQREASTKRHELTVEAILHLIEQHLASPRSSRLPVLVVAAAYDVAKDYLRKQTRHLQPHTAADVRVGSLGDLEVVMQDGQRIVIVYEIKTRRVTKNDIDRALQKVNNTPLLIDQYTFVTTAAIDPAVVEYANALSKQKGMEFMILDCLQFIKHFLHMFYELRMQFLDRYQQLLLNEPESAVSHALKTRFLELRKAVTVAPDEA